MEKKLPKVFANEVNKKFSNNEKVYYSNKNEEVIGDRTLDNNNGKNIYQKINSIFNSPNYVYKADVKIKTRDGQKITKVIGKNMIHLITIDNELIPISEVEDIERI